MPTPTKADFAKVHAKLLAILRRVERGSLKGRKDKRGNYVLLGPATEQSRGRELWFGSVRRGKSYVSYHLIPVYAFPELLKGMSPALKKRMQGKSCFNFTKTDDALFKELAELTERGYQRFRETGFLP